MDSVTRQHETLPQAAAPGDRGLWLIGAALLALAGLTVLLPGAAVVSGVASWISGAPARAESPGAGAGLWLLLRTVAYAGGIGVISTALAWPAAWAIGRTARAGRRAAMGAMVAVPLLLPNYLAYAGLNLLRAPMTPLGDWLAQHPWASVSAGKAMAVLGLSLWAWPLAALVLAPAVQRIPRETIEALDLDGAGALWRLRRTATFVVMLRSPIGLAVGVVAAVMLGSAVPLHVAQIDTFATRLWLRLSLTTDPAAAWVEAWPLMLLAVAAAGVAFTRLRRRGDEPESEADAENPGLWRRNAGATVGAGAVWGLSIIFPTALFISSLRQPGGAWSARTAAEFSGAFWRNCGEAVVASAGTAAMVGVVGSAIAALSWCALSSPRGRRGVTGAALVCIGLWLVAGLSPGVLVGSALTRLWGAGPWGDQVRDSAAILVLAHTTRFAMVAALVGWWLATLETRAGRDMRLLDGAGGVRGWWLARASRGGIGAVVGAGLAVAALSFHEIEAAVMLQPPGLASLPQLILEDLHFARDARLAAAAVNLVGVGTVLAGLAGWLVARGGMRRP